MAKAQQQGRQENRPLSVTLVIWGVFLLGLINIWRVAALYRQSDLLRNLGVSLDPRVRMIFTLIWALIFLLLALSLWQKWKLARFITPLLLVSYGLYQIGLERLFTVTAKSNDNWQMDLILYGTVFIFTTWALNQKHARQFFD